MLFVQVGISLTILRFLYYSKLLRSHFYLIGSISALLCPFPFFSLLTLFLSNCGSFLLLWLLPRLWLLGWCYHSQPLLLLLLLLLPPAANRKALSLLQLANAAKHTAPFLALPASYLVCKAHRLTCLPLCCLLHLEAQFTPQ